MKITITGNLKKEDDSKPPDYFSEFDSHETVNAITDALTANGHAVEFIDAERPDLFAYFKSAHTDIVFNIAEGVNGKFRESNVPGILDYLDIPYTGSNTFSLALALNKALTKKILMADNVPTPAFQLFSSKDQTIDERLKFPLIIKPNYEGSAKGIGLSNVVYSRETAQKKIREIMDCYRQEVIAEEFIDGIELTVGILENGAIQVLPILEIDFSSCRVSGEHFYSWKVKELQDRKAEGFTPVFYCPARLNERTCALVKDIAIKTHQAVGCKDVSRTDIRLSADNVPYVLEINPLPGLNPKNSNLPLMAYAAGMKYEEIINSILMNAYTRRKINNG